MSKLYYNSAIYSSNFKNILINTLSRPFLLNLLIAIRFLFIGKSLNNVLSISSFRLVGIFKSLMIASKSSLITRTASISMSLPLQWTYILLAV